MACNNVVYTCIVGRINIKRHLAAYPIIPTVELEKKAIDAQRKLLLVNLNHNSQLE
jgi:hypothetical protein